jgi:tetratricopeptide (TPR) repeat protein
LHETPKLQAVVRNVGDQTRPLPRPSELLYLKIAGEIWRWKGPASGKPAELKPGKAMEERTILLTEDWAGLEDRRLELLPGRYMAQVVMFISEPAPPNAGPGGIRFPGRLRIESNVVVIEIPAMGERPDTADAEADASSTLEAELHEIWRQRDRDLAGAEAFGKKLLDKYTQPHEQSLIYYQLAEAYAQSGQVSPSKTIEYARAGWWYLNDPIKKARLFVYWGDALQLSKNRREAARIYLRGLRFCLESGLPKDKPERPAVSRFRVNSPPEVVEDYRRRNQLEMAAWKHAELIAELIEQRQALTGQLVQLYAQEPNAFDELRELVMKYLGSEQAAERLIAAAQAYRANPKIAMPVFTSIGGGDPNPEADLGWGETSEGIRVRLRVDTKTWASASQ